MMPAGIPPHKLTEEDPGAEHRLRMCQLCVKDVPGVSASALEIERGGPSYTVDTLRSIHARHPHAQLTFIVGADIASTLPTWREPAELLELANLAVAAREGPGRGVVLDTIAPLLASRSSIGGDERSPRVSFLSMPAIEVSSSMVREHLARGESIEDLVGPAVAGYIAGHGLYRASVQASG